jgi:hypothetical protein
MQLVLAGPVLVAPSTPGEKVEDPPVNFSKSSMWGMRAHRWNTAFHSPRDPRVAWSFDRKLVERYGAKHQQRRSDADGNSQKSIKTSPFAFSATTPRLPASNRLFVDRFRGRKQDVFFNSTSQLFSKSLKG